MIESSVEQRSNGTWYILAFERMSGSPSVEIGSFKTEKYAEAMRRWIYMGFKHPGAEPETEDKKND